jgi:hypothetical protein
MTATGKTSERNAMRIIKVIHTGGKYSSKISYILQYLQNLEDLRNRYRDLQNEIQEKDAKHFEKVEEARLALINLANLVVKYQKGKGKLSTCEVSYDDVIAFFKQYHYDPSPLQLPLVFPKKEHATREKILKVLNIAVPYPYESKWTKKHQERLDFLEKEIDTIRGKLKLSHLTNRNECRLMHLEKGLYPLEPTFKKLKNSLICNELTRVDFCGLMALEEEAKAKLLEEAKATADAKKKEEMVRIL